MPKPESAAWGATALPAANFAPPTPDEQNSGWPDLVGGTGRRLSPSRQVLNEWMRRVGAWLERLSDTPPVFATPGEAADGLDNGQLGIVAYRPPNPLETAWSKTAAEMGFAAEPVLVATTHRWAILHDGANTRTAVVDLLTGTVQATSALYTADAFCTDGRYLYLCGNGSPVRLTLPTTGALLPLDVAWSPAGSFGADVVAVCTDGVRLYAALASGHIRAITISSGAVAWTSTTLAGEALRGISVRGPDVVVVMDLDAGGANDGFRVFNASTGAVVAIIGDNSISHQSVCSDRAGFILGGVDRYRIGAAGSLNGTRFLNVDNCGYHGTAEVLAMASVAGVWAVMLNDAGGGRVQLRRRPQQTWTALGTEPPPAGFTAWSSTGDLFTGLGLTGTHVVMSGPVVADFTSAAKILMASALPQGPRLVRRGHEADPTREAHNSLLEWGAWL
jgi:hypothetical protein